MVLNEYIVLHCSCYTVYFIFSLQLLSLFKQLADTEEYIDGELSGNLGEVLIRCNNVLYISAAPSS